jgi:tyrosine-protein phosphatase YwqE
MHNHLLPGIDDGAENVATSQSLAQSLQALGYTHTICTPHIMSGMYNNNRTTISDAKQQLDSVETYPITIVNTAAEYMLDEAFLQQLEASDPLLTLYQNNILVEFSYVAAPIMYQDIFFQIQLKGYRPVLAHPERYSYFANNLQNYEGLKAMGCMLQLNALSLGGYYGKTAQNIAIHLLSERLVSYIGTDTHAQRHVQALQQMKIDSKIFELIQQQPLLHQQMLAVFQ